MIDWIFSVLEHYSSKINTWAWQKRWGNRKTGLGYQESWIKGYKKWKKKMADQYRKLQAEKWRQISLHKAASEKLETLCSNFKYGKKLKRGKTIEAMAWQYNVIKDTNKSIVFRNGKYEVIENG